MAKEERSLFERLYEAGEEQVSRLTREVTSHPSFSSVMEKTLRSASETKGRVDKNVDHLLSLLNIPSKMDYHKLLAKVETLQGSLVNLNIKLDRLIAAVEKQKKPPRRRSKQQSSAVHSEQNPSH